MFSSPRRSGSKNCFVLPPTPAKCEEDKELVGAGTFASKRVSKPNHQSEGSESAGTFASKRVSKPNHQSEGSESAGTFASQRVSKPNEEGEGAGTVEKVESEVKLQ